MMNFSGQNRGFAYAKYGSPAIAASAIQLLHGHMIEPGVSLCVRHSTEKRQLCIGGFPVSTRQADISQVQHACFLFLIFNSSIRFVGKTFVLQKSNWYLPVPLTAYEVLERG